MTIGDAIWNIALLVFIAFIIIGTILLLIAEPFKAILVLGLIILVLNKMFN